MLVKAIVLLSLIRPVDHIVTQWNICDDAGHCHLTGDSTHASANSSIVNVPPDYCDDGWTLVHTREMGPMCVRELRAPKTSPKNGE